MNAVRATRRRSSALTDGFALGRRRTNKQTSRGQLLEQMTRRDDIRRSLNEVEKALGQAQRQVSRRHYSAAYDRANNPLWSLATRCSVRPRRSASR